MARPERPSDPELRWLSLRGGRVAYTDEGQGPAVVALHGCPGSHRDWRWLGAAIEPELRLIRLDLPGFGQTPLETLPAADFASRAALVVEVLDALGVEVACALAHSAGGPLALELAANYPRRIGAVALVGAPGLRPHRPLREARFSHRISPLLRVPGLRWLLTRWLRVGFERAGFPKQLPDAAVQQTMHIVAHMDFEQQAHRVQALTVPALVAWCDDDTFIDADISEGLAAACPIGPRLRFAEGGHYLQKTRAVEIAAALVPWWRGVAGAAR